MSGKTVCETDTDIDVEEFKLEPTDTDQHHSEPIEYPCDQCDYNAANSQVLSLHKEWSHLRKLSCTLCAFVTHEQNALIKHKRLYHENVKIKNAYSCKECDFKGNLDTLSLHHKHTKQ